MRCLIFSVILFFAACSQNRDLIENSKNSRKNYIYLSHTRLNSNESIFNKVYDLNLKYYDMILLGGDLGNITFKDSLIFHLDSVLDLKNENTLWSIGNHDDTTNENFNIHTGKNKYDYFTDSNATIITLDSQDSLSNIIGKQKKFLFDILDTIQTKNIIILSHKLIFMDKHPVMDSLINKICNGKKGDCFYCHNPNNFQSEIYPKLLKAKRSGKNIYWIGGDLGVKTSSFEFVDNQNIVFLGNGLWFSNQKNSVLIFSSFESNLKYKFVDLDSLIKYQSPRYIDSLFLD
jgi:hypothetical protein